jgi:hypothetical protein
MSDVKSIGNRRNSTKIKTKERTQKKGRKRMEQINKKAPALPRVSLRYLPVFLYRYSHQEKSTPKKKKAQNCQDW